MTFIKTCIDQGLDTVSPEQLRTYLRNLQELFAPEKLEPYQGTELVGHVMLQIDACLQIAASLGMLLAFNLGKQSGEIKQSLDFMREFLKGRIDDKIIGVIDRKIKREMENAPK